MEKNPLHAMVSEFFFKDRSVLSTIAWCGYFVYRVFMLAVRGRHYKTSPSNEWSAKRDVFLSEIGTRFVLIIPLHYLYSLLTGCRDLEQWRRRLSDDLARVTSHLIQQLTKRDHLLLQRQRHCDVITAILQAASPKRSKS